MASLKLKPINIKISGAFTSTAAGSTFIIPSNHSATVTFEESATNTAKAFRRFMKSFKGKAATPSVDVKGRVLRDQGHVDRISIHRLFASLNYHRYVMGSWHRWGTQARVRWLVHLRVALTDTVDEIDHHLFTHYREGEMSLSAMTAQRWLDEAVTDALDSGDLKLGDLLKSAAS